MIVWRRTKAEVFVANHPCPRLFGQAGGATKMIGMRMGDDDRVDVFDCQLRLLETRDERFVRRGPRQPRVDKRHSVVVYQCVAVDVPESGQ